MSEELDAPPCEEASPAAPGQIPKTIENPFQPDREVVRLHLSQRLTCWKIPITDGAVALQDYAADRLQVVAGTQVVNVLLQVQ